MSEDFSINHNAKFSNINAIDYYQQIKNISSNEELQHPYDHFYASYNDSSDIETHKQKLTCQTGDSEVRFLKEWLLLHLDLIQQQNEEILSKERTIIILQQENEMLKERINCLEQGIPLELHKDFANHSNENKFEDNTIEDMTQDLGVYDDVKDTALFEGNSKNVDTSALVEVQETNTNQSNKIREEICESSNLDNLTVENSAELNFDSRVDSNIKTQSEPADILNSGVIYNFSSELDSMRHLRMSIRRKRVCSNSSAVSQNGSALEERKSLKKIIKRRKRSLKDNQILTTPDLYVNQIGDPILGIPNEPEPAEEELKESVLEVPRWRVKLYASCYTMEGTENLDDEVYLRRHTRLEIDERRRKRWDIQRIREQRVIEKLKQRQEKIDSHLKNETMNIMSCQFWPSVDDIKFIEVCDEIPVSAFGYPIPKISPSDFSLPWMNGTVMAKKEKTPVKKRTRRRKSKR